MNRVLSFENEILIYEVDICGCCIKVCPKEFRYGFLIFLFAMFFVMLWNTYRVFAGAKDLTQAVTLLWTFNVLGIGHTMET